MNVSLQDLGIPVDSTTLRDAIAWAQRSIVIYGKTYDQPRLTRWYADVPYTYSGLSWEPAPMPDLVARIRDRVQELVGEPFNSVLCNLYRDGSDTVGWHADDEPIFGPDPVVASVSFGATRTFQLRRNGNKTEVFDFELTDGSLFVMGRGIQTGWKHRLKKTSTPCGPRVNLTFRTAV